MTTLIDRLHEVMHAKGWTHADLVRVSGQSHSVVSQWLGKGSKLIKSIGKMEAAEGIEAASGYAALWIATGKGPKLADRAPGAHRLVAASPAAGYTHGPAPPSIDEALVRIGAELAREMPDFVREDIADEMQRWVQRRGLDHTRQRIAQLLDSASAAADGTSGKQW